MRRETIKNLGRICSWLACHYCFDTEHCRQWVWFGIWLSWLNEIRTWIFVQIIKNEYKDEEMDPLSSIENIVGDREENLRAVVKVEKNTERGARYYILFVHPDFLYIICYMCFCWKHTRNSKYYGATSGKDCKIWCTTVLESVQSVLALRKQWEIFLPHKVDWWMSRFTASLISLPSQKTSCFHFNQRAENKYPSWF